jgi:serine/threonine protein kinase
MHAEESQLVHCDIKPGNIFIDKLHQVKLIDFSIAREL